MAGEKGRWIGARLVVPLLAALFVLGATRLARAAVADACAVVWAFSELREREQAALRRLCEDGVVSDAAVISGAVFRLGALGGPRAAALATILAKGAEVLTIEAVRGRAPDLRAAQEALGRLPGRLAAGRKRRGSCEELEAEIAEFVAAIEVGEPAGSPFLHDDPALLGCLGDAEALRSTYLVALRADNVASAVVVAATPDFVTRTRLDAGAAVAVGGRRFLVAAVPPSAAVTIVAQVRNVDTPAAWQGVVGHDLVAWEEPPAMTCLNLDVSLDERGALYLDGVPVRAEGREIARTLPVSRADHHLVALDCPPGEERCHVRYQATLAGSTLQRRVNDCRSLRLDLSRRSRSVVAVVEATQNELCNDAPLRADGLPGMAAEYLRDERPRERYEFRNLAVIAALTDALVVLRERLKQDGTTTGEFGGAERGADSARLISGAASEAWRQGIDLLLSFELRCTRIEAGWRYHLETKGLSLSSLFSREQGPAEGLDLQGLLAVESEELVLPERYRQALEMTIDRLLGLDYVRLMHRRIAGSYRTSPEIRVAHHDGGRCREAGATHCGERRPRVTARRVSAATRPAVCGLLEGRTVRRAAVIADAQRVYAGAGGREVTLELAPEVGAGDGRAAVERGRLDVLVPGWYLVLARWADEEAASDALCVELTATAHEGWVDASMSSGALHLLPRENPEVFYLRARVGYTRYLRPSLGLGPFVGYALTRYALPGGRPSWGDLGSLNAEPLRWARHALLIGGLAEYRARLRPLPFDLRVRAAPTVSVGFLALSGIPAELTEFLGARGGQVSDLDVDFNLHFDVGGSYNVGPLTILNVMQVGLNAIDDRLHRVSTGVRSNGGLFLGFGMGLGIGGPR